jgi:hypothetical protein
MLNAAFAVIRWKKLCGFYADDEHWQPPRATLRARSP